MALASLRSARFRLRSSCSQQLPAQGLGSSMRWRSLTALIMSLTAISGLLGKAAVMPGGTGGYPRDVAANLMRLRREQASVADALRRERAVLAEERNRLQRAAQALSEERASLRQQANVEVQAAEERLAHELQQFQNYKAKTKAEEQSVATALKRERDTLMQERQRLKAEGKALEAERQSLFSQAERMQRMASTNRADTREAAALQRERLALEQEQERLLQEHQELKQALRREKAELDVQAQRLLRERQDFKRQAAAKPSSDVGVEAEDVKSELAKAKDQLTQQAAEFQKYRSRIESQEKQRAREVLIKLAKPLLSVLDDFKRAMDFGDSASKDALAPLRRKLLAVLEAEFKLRPMSDVKGQVFNPELHEAVGISAGDSLPDTILEELEEGFVSSDSIYGAVVRPAKVIVSSGPAADYV